MSERYTRLFSLPNNLHLDGAPLLIAAGALLKDTQSGKVLVQLKLQNLYHAPLTACKVHIHAFDPSGVELEGVENFSYLDLHAPCGADFGTKTPITLPDSTTRRVSACVIQAVFEDGTVWQNPVSEWPQVELRSQLLSNRFQDAEMIKQYEIEVGGNCKYVPETVGGLSLCTCGTINLSDSKSCCNCGRDLDKLTAALDIDLLTRKKEARLAQEAADRAQKEQEDRIAAAAAKKRTKKIAIIASAVAVLVVAITVILNTIVIPANKYKAAEALLAARDYDGAVAAFTELGNYKDSAERATNVPYVRAENLLSDGDYDGALKAFQALGNYGDAAERANEIIQKQLQMKYDHAEELFSAKDYDGAVAAFTELGGYKDSAEKIYEVRYTEATDLEESGETAKAAIAFGKLGDYSDAIEKSLSLWEKVPGRETITASGNHAAALRNNGTIATVYGRFAMPDDYKLSSWTDIVAVSAGNYNVVGLKSDGTVVNTGHYSIDTSNWTDIVSIAGGGDSYAMGAQVVGLKPDGTVIAAGANDTYQCEVSDWSDVMMIDAVNGFTVGLKTDGTVLSVGYNEYGQCDVGEWTDIVAISVGDFNTVGLKSDGTVVVAGDNRAGEKEVTEWRNIIAVAAGRGTIYGLQSDGTVVLAGYDDEEYNLSETANWTGIVSIAAGGNNVYGLKDDGTVVVAGLDVWKEGSVDDWVGIKTPKG